MWEPKASKALWERAGFAAGSHRDSTFHRSSPPQFSRALSILASHSRAGSSSSRLGEAIGGGSLLLDQSPVWWVLFTLSKSPVQAMKVQIQRAALLRVEEDHLEGGIVRRLPERALHSFDLLLGVVLRVSCHGWAKSNDQMWAN